MKNVIFVCNTAFSLNPIKIAVFTTNPATVNAQVILNDYSSGSAVLKYTGPIVSVTPNSSGIIVVNISNNVGNDWGSITATQVNSYYLLDIKIGGTLYAQYRLDQLIIMQAQSGITDTDGNLSPNGNGNGGLGDDNSRWSDLFVEGNTIHVGPAGGVVSGTEMTLSYNLSPNKGTINVDNHDVMEITKNEVNITNSNSVNTSNTLGVNSNGIGNGISVILTNSSNGSRGLDVSQSGVGPGVFATSVGGNAVWGKTSSISSAGVIGDNTYGEAVVGRNRGGNGVGAVVGRNDSSGYGVRGFNTKNGYGVLGQAGISGGTGTAGRFENVNAANTSDALQVVTNSAGNAARFTGNVVVNGNLTVSGTVAKGGGSFMIDHPLDPKNKILYHSFVESPDMKNINDGVIILDSKGEAWVQLPNWFEALNGDFRYQLTAIGSPGPNLYIAEEVNNNRFKIAGGIAGMKVSWMVTGIRHDPFAMKHRIQVEVEKTPEQKGHYLQPDAYGEIVKPIVNTQSIQTQSSSANLINSKPKNNNDLVDPKDK